MATINELAEAVVDKIIDDLTDRKGLGDVWRQIDEVIQSEIKEIWMDLVIEALE